MKKKMIITSIMGILVLVCVYIYREYDRLYYEDYDIQLANIDVKGTNLDDDYIDVIVTRKPSKYFDYEFTCVASNDEDTIEIKSENGECKFEIPINDDYSVYLKNEYNETEKYRINDYYDDDMIFEFEDDEIYLVVGEEYKLKYHDKHLMKMEEGYKFITDKENVISIENDVVKAIGPGEVTISLEGTDSSLKIISTNLITAPTYNKNKKIIPCHQYTDEEVKILEKFLEKRVKDAGLGTRAGAVAAARFLTLEFPYKIPYFYENGRLTHKGSMQVDGEGRYYHKGLYLVETKKQYITKSHSGPVIWGCPLTNQFDNPRFGYYAGTKMPNGLDCSGFVSWSLYNGGLDPGDIGAGEDSWLFQMTDLGEYTPLTRKLLKSGKVKVGDLLNFHGHIAMLVGYDGKDYYVAESLEPYKGASIVVYSENKLVNTFQHVVLMDSFYEEDGNYTEFWK